MSMYVGYLQANYYYTKWFTHGFRGLQLRHRYLLQAKASLALRATFSSPDSVCSRNAAFGRGARPDRPRSFTFPGATRCRLPPPPTPPPLPFRRPVREETTTAVASAMTGPRWRISLSSPPESQPSSSLPLSLPLSEHPQMAAAEPPQNTRRTPAEHPQMAPKEPPQNTQRALAEHPQNTHKTPANGSRKAPSEHPQNISQHLAVPLLYPNSAHQTDRQSDDRQSRARAHKGKRAAPTGPALTCAHSRQQQRGVRQSVSGHGLGATSA